jgi:tight adherence protein C
MLSPLTKVILISIAVVIAVYLVYRRLRRWWFRRTSQIVRSARPEGSARPAPAAPPRPQPGSIESDSPSPPEPAADDSDFVFGRLTPILAAMLPESEQRKRRNIRTLQQAGHYGAQAWHNLAAVRYVAIMLPILCGLLLLVITPPRVELLIMVGLVALPMLGWSLPTLYVRSRAAERMWEIEHSMPDVLDMMNMCVSQGMTVPASLARVSRELAQVSPPLSKELAIVVEQTRVGSLEQALENFGRRIDLPEVHSFTNLLVQTEKLGTSMSGALAEYSDSMRESLRQQADQKANSAAFKLLFPTVLCLMPAVFMILLGPATVELSRFFNEGSNILDSSVQSANEILSR